MATTLTPYLNFDGTCEEAMRLYERCLDGRSFNTLAEGGMVQMPI